MKSVEFKESITLLMLFISFTKVVLADKLLWQRRNKCCVFSVSRGHEYIGFTVLAKLRLNLCYRKRLKPKRNLLTYLTPNGLYSQHKTVWWNLITFCYKELIESLTK